jgi:hypothetical protein
MSLLKSLGAESLFGDVQRMDKRQVCAQNCDFYFHRYSRIIKKNSQILVLLSSTEFWHDCLVGLDDLEGFDGCYGQ